MRYFGTNRKAESVAVSANFLKLKLGLIFGPCILSFNQLGIIGMNGQTSRSSYFEPNYGPGESFDGNPFGKPGQDFRHQSKAVMAAEERERLERLRANMPEPPERNVEVAPLPDSCTVCSIQ